MVKIVVRGGETKIIVKGEEVKIVLRGEASFLKPVPQSNSSGEKDVRRELPPYHQKKISIFKHCTNVYIKTYTKKTVLFTKIGMIFVGSFDVLMLVITFTIFKDSLL